MNNLLSIFYGDQKNGLLAGYLQNACVYKALLVAAPWQPYSGNILREVVDGCQVEYE
jgi:hypothetical protein